MKKDIFNCKICKEKFIRKSKIQIYCCHCSYKANHKTTPVKENQETKLCPVCEKFFIPPAKNHKICSDVCRERKANEKAKDRWLNKKKKVTKPGLGNILDRARVAKKYTWWLKKYNACRG